MKKILILVGEMLSANGICAKAIMDELKNNGYEVMCITNQEYKEAKIEFKNGIKIRRIKPRLTYRMNNWCKNRQGNLSYFWGKLTYILNKIKLILSIPFWPLISPLYTFRFYRASKELYDSDRYDCIISIYTQIDAIIAGYFMKKKFPDIKFVPYFLDSLSGGYGPKVFSKDWTIRRGLKWERRLLKYADKIIVMKSSEKHHEIYSKSEPYFTRIKVLDIPLLKKVDKKHISAPINFIDKDKINLVYAGSIPCHIRNPKYILEIYKRINIKGCKLTIIGSNTCPDLIEKAQAESKCNEIEVIKHIPHEEVINILINADILINIGNNIETMVPSKIFEYMSVGKPIISTYPIKEEPSIKYLNIYPLSLLIEEDWEKIDENVKKVEEFIINCRGKRVDFDILKNKLYLNTPQAIVDELNTLFK